MDRIEPPLTGGERDTLVGFLDYQRATLAGKCAGLDEDQLRKQAAPPSELTLLGLVRHMADVERAWFRRCVGAEHDLPRVWGAHQHAFDVTGAVSAEAFSTWEAEVGRAREIERAVESLDSAFSRPGWDDDFSLRFVLVHMIEEYARHNGHADLLREAIDGSTGE
ncbi:DinB family protein [Saccharopolyspora rhizosphaerae]|uniref:DinB family protein n=1 Tax=Saccharopolyspora rhizosphaerae TaxID=2492662 RepID=A0A3R8Q744_9PSEU|nr:DinB family protein [Saccharopolyspora rhizosphaerae]RRO18401.1 DinB family protein [Saccharopolyspora rhizosphaerae]